MFHHCNLINCNPNTTLTGAQSLTAQEVDEIVEQLNNYNIAIEISEMPRDKGKFFVKTYADNKEDERIVGLIFEKYVH